MAGKLPQNISLASLLVQWPQQLNPIIVNPLVNGSLLTNIVLKNGSVTFPHYLGRQIQGWFIVDQDAAAEIYRSQPLNNQTLTLTSNAAVTVNLWVF